MNRRQILQLGMSASALLLSGCWQSHDKPSKGIGRPAKLGASFLSLQSAQVARAHLDRNGWSNVRVIEAPQSQPPKGRPPLEITTLEADGTDRDMPGTLRLDFFNDELMATWFYPKDPARYRANFGQQDRTDEFATMSHGTDYLKREYVLWEDARLRRQLDEWIRKYS